MEKNVIQTTKIAELALRATISIAVPLWSKQNLTFSVDGTYAFEWLLIIQAHRFGLRKIHMWEKNFPKTEYQLTSAYLKANRVHLTYDTSKVNSSLFDLKRLCHFLFELRSIHPILYHPPLFRSFLELQDN